MRLRNERSTDTYPFTLPVVRGLHTLCLPTPVTFFVGENGCGKSTLLEAIAVNFGFNAEGGSRHFNFATQETHTSLHQHIALGKGPAPRDGYFLRAESFYNVATEIERLDSAPSFDPPVTDAYGGKSLHAQSHGESVMSLVTHRFFGEGLYILDEPESALSPSRQMALLAHIHTLVAQGSQFIIATHSPILMAYPGATIFAISETGIAPSAYRDTEHYLVTRAFLNNTDDMLAQLLAEE